MRKAHRAIYESSNSTTYLPRFYIVGLFNYSQFYKWGTITLYSFFFFCNIWLNLSDFYISSFEENIALSSTTKVITYGLLLHTVWINQFPHCLTSKMSKDNNNYLYYFQHFWICKITNSCIHWWIISLDFLGLNLCYVTRKQGSLLHR